MTLTELKNAIDIALQFEKNPDNVDVVITTKLPYMTVGQAPCVGVKSAYMGFDWEAGQFRIIPEENLMCIKHDVPQEVINWNDVYCCPKCEHILSINNKDLDIKFCSKCGQAVRWND